MNGRYALEPGSATNTESMSRTPGSAGLTADLMGLELLPWLILPRFPRSVGAWAVCEFPSAYGTLVILLFGDSGCKPSGLKGDQDFLIDRDRLIKLLGLLGSDHNGEIASAGRMANALIKEAGVTWADVIAPDTVQRELVGVLRAENDELRKKIRRLLVENNELQARTRASQALYYRKRNRVKRLAALIIALMTVWGILAYFGLFD